MMTKGSTYFCILVLGLVALTGCKSGVSVKPGPIPVEPLTPVVSSPTLVLPTENIYYSGDSQLHIAGFCVPGNTVYLTGDAIMEASCEDSMYSFLVPKDQDGIFTFHITQVIYGRTSNPIPLTWIRQTSTAPPALTFPTSDPFYSAQSVLTITGNCQSGSEISLGLEASGTTTCENSTFSLAVPKFADGSYDIEVRQKDRSGNIATVNFVWEKSRLMVSPETPQIQVDQEQVLTLSGGSLQYTISMVTNNSGATLDDATKTYKAGTVAGVIDTVGIQDSLGAYRELFVEVIPGVPDHMVLPADSGDGFVGPMGQIAGENIKVQVVDKFGNGVSAFPVVFQVAGGDAHILDNPLQVTDQQGYADVLVRLGYVSTRSTIVAMPDGLVLPDAAASGDKKLFVDIYSEHSGGGDLGLTFDVGLAPNNALGGDFNSDGLLDLVVLNSGTPSIGLLRGTGKGLFADMAEIPTCNGPSSMVQGDFDGSGSLDLIVACAIDANLRFYSGAGDGTFPSVQVIALDSAEDEPVAMVTGDFNADDILDLAVLSVSNQTLGVRLGVGDGTFLAPTLLNTEVGPSVVAVADVDLQNGPDLLVLNSGSDSFGVYLNDGSGAMAPAVFYGTVAAPADFAVGDFNTDGWPDLVVVGATDEVISLILNNQTGAFDTGNDTPVTGGPIAAEVMDLDLDSVPDIVVAGINDGILTAFRGLGNGTFEPGVLQQVVNTPINLAAGDFNGDTTEDLVVVSTGEKKIQLLPGQGSPLLGLQRALGPNPSDIARGDFNDDGLLDLVILEKGSAVVKVLYSNGLGHFSDGPTLSTPPNPSAIEVADLNADGFLDLVAVFEVSNSASVILNDGAGGFLTPAPLATGSQPTSALIADINADGTVDLLFTNGGSGSISIYPGVGDGTFGVRSDVTVGAQPVAAAVGDLNKDGLLDLVVANMSEGKVSVLLGNGDGTFQTQTKYDAQSGPNGVVLGYFNADDFLDIAVSNEYVSSLSVFAGKGDGSFYQAAIYATSLVPTPLKKMDVNGDGNEDLVTGSRTGQSVTVNFGSVIGDFSVQYQMQVPFNPHLIETVDLTGREGLDLVILDNISEKLWVLMGH